MSDAAAWMDNQVDRLLQEQRGRVATAQLTVTFSTGLAAALLGVAIADEGSSALKWPAVATFFLALGLAATVLFADRFRMPNHDAVLVGRTQGDPQILRDLRVAALGAVDFNARYVVPQIKRLSQVQLIVGTASALFSLAWLAFGGGA